MSPQFDPVSQVGHETNGRVCEGLVHSSNAAKVAQPTEVVVDGVLNVYYYYYYYYCCCCCCCCCCCYYYYETRTTVMASVNGYWEGIVWLLRKQKADVNRENSGEVKVRYGTDLLFSQGCEGAEGFICLMHDSYTFSPVRFSSGTLKISNTAASHGPFGKKFDPPPRVLGSAHHPCHSQSPRSSRLESPFKQRLLRSIYGAPTRLLC